MEQINDASLWKFSTRFFFLLLFIFTEQLFIYTQANEELNVNN